MTDLTELLITLGGVARTRDLEVAGISRRQLDAALTSGRCIRPRRGWIALRESDSQLVAAARSGVVLTCLTAAQRLGLWVHDTKAPLIHIAPRTKRTEYDRSKVVVHWAKPLVPRHPTALVDPIENVLAHVVECVPEEQALATIESALNKRLVAIQTLKRMPLCQRFRRLLESASPFADSALETYLRERLRWLRLPIYLLTFIDGHRTDVLIGDRLALQIDGGTHVGAQRDEDIRHDASLRLMGYTVFRVSYIQVMFRWHEVQDLIMRAIAQGLHLAA